MENNARSLAPKAAYASRASADPVVSRSTLMARIEGAFLTFAAAFAIGPLKAKASANCPIFCQGMFNWNCYLEQLPPILSDRIECGSSADFFAFADLGTDGVTELGYISDTGGAMIAGCVTYDSFTCVISTC